ncbi:hypothetical protein DPX16_4720 [Anabarilius grahami]|uniref:Uncharacterized protein n=1 Tax=Anabarilius grahami TaxID=495550 RepID=A0A3N0YGK9_ANAGA|nr:hypothetical protein DPX16_4720 [Anabarilius grahami]
MASVLPYQSHQSGFDLAAEKQRLLDMNNTNQTLPVSDTTTVIEGGAKRRCSPKANGIALCKFVTNLRRFKRILPSGLIFLDFPEACGTSQVDPCQIFTRADESQAPEDKCGKWVFWPRATAQSWRHSSPHLSAPFELRQPRNTETGLRTTSYPASPDGFCFQATRLQYRTRGLCIRLVRRLLGSLVAWDEGSGRGFLKEGSQPCGGAYSPLGKNSYTP